MNRVNSFTVEELDVSQHLIKDIVHLSSSGHLTERQDPIWMPHTRRGCP